MRYYLSSFRLGAAPDVLHAMLGGRPLAHVTNAADALPPEEARASVRADQERMAAAGFSLLPCDLRAFADAPDQLADLLATCGGVWVRGGNTFVLRDAMQRSGLDGILRRIAGSGPGGRPDFVYAGYSAGACVLAPCLRPLALADDPSHSVYPDDDPRRWAGLGLLDTLIAPHYRSDHGEAAAVERMVALCMAQGIPHTPLRDGEVLIR